MRFLKFVAIALVLIACVVLVVGYRLPKAHQASREREYAYAPEKVYQAIATPTQYPRWRSGVQKVEFLPDSEKMKRFKETALDGEVTYVIEENVPNQRFVTRIAQEGLPYGGSWTYELEPTQKGTTLRITEDGEVYNPVFRFVARYIIKPTRSIDRYMSDLDKRLTSGIGDVGTP